MNAETTGLFQGLAPLLTNRTVIMTVAADGNGMLTLNVIPKKVRDDESDALTTALCITASADELDRTLAHQLREYTDAQTRTASNIQAVKDALAAAEKAERAAAEERRAKKFKGKPESSALAEAKKAPEPAQASLGLFDDASDRPTEAGTEPTSAAAAV